MVRRRRFIIERSVFETIVQRLSSELQSFLPKEKSNIICAKFYGINRHQLHEIARRMINRSFFLNICIVTPLGKARGGRNAFFHREVAPFTFVETTLYFHLVISFGPLKASLHVFVRALLSAFHFLFVSTIAFSWQDPGERSWFRAGAGFRDKGRWIVQTYSNVLIRQMITILLHPAWMIFAILPFSAVWLPWRLIVYFSIV